ncbi:MAG TPA: hypothetical protein VD971_02830 [Phycisphaerales bacterium]|nr:hypothetical protein [Phycisphaerales bacterium]
MAEDRFAAVREAAPVRELFAFLTVAWLFVGSGLFIAPAYAKDEDDAPPAVSDDSAPAWLRRLAMNEQSESVRRYHEQKQARLSKEKEIRRLRLKHFGQIRSTQIRQEGILKLRELAEPALFPLLIDVFKREDDDVRLELLDIFKRSESLEGDAALAWQAVFDKDARIREAATQRLDERQRESEKPQLVRDQARMVVYEGLTSSRASNGLNAARLAENLKLVELIPWLAASQLRAQAVQTGGAREGAGALAWIAVGTQTSFVSDLQPVVAEAAVAFDPQVSSVTEGTLVRVIDATVYSYNVDIHNALVRLSSAAWGQSTARLGWDYRAWMSWYRDEFEPYWAAKQAAAAEENK